MTRLKYLLKRVLLSIPVVWFGTSMTWFIIFMGPVDPASRLLSEGQVRNPAAYRAAQEQLGLNEPPLEHYVSYLVDLYTFDLGRTFLLYQGSNVNALIMDFLPRTLWLGFWSVAIAVCVGVPLGFYAGLRSNTGADYLASLGGIVWRAMPNFWLAIMLLALLGSTESLVGFDWENWVVDLDALSGSPELGYLSGPLLAGDGLFNFVLEPEKTLTAFKKVLPAALVLGSASMGNEMRIGRTAVLEVKNEDFVDMAKAKGVSDRVLVWKHVLRNALVPLVPIITSEAFLLIGGSVLVETVFAINGIGKLFVDAAISGDLPLVGALMYVFILMIVGINLVQDLLYTVIDPRVGLEGA